MRVGLKSCFRSCVGHKLILLSLLLLQLLYLIIHFAVNVKSFIVIGDQFQNLMGLLQNANYDAQTIDAGTPFMQNIGMFYSNLSALIASVKQLIGYELLIFLILGVALWTGTALLFRRLNVKEAVKLYGHMLARALVFLIPIYALIIVVLDRSLSIALGDSSLYVVLVLCFVLFYFMLVSLALEGTLVDVIKRSFVVGLKKIHYIIGILVLIAAVASGSGYLVYLALDASLWILTLPILLVVAVLVVGRILFVAVVRST